MHQSDTIAIPLDSVDQLVEQCPPSPFRRRRLREEAEEFLIECVTALPSRTAAKLVIVLPESEAPQADILVEAIREHFNYLRLETEAKLKRMRRFGWRSFGVAIAFLTIAIAIVQLMRRYLPSGTLSSVAIEGLIILAWIALWRPGELLLYERYPLQRDARLFRKLEQCEIQFSWENGNARYLVLGPPSIEARKTLHIDSSILSILSNMRLSLAEPTGLLCGVADRDTQYESINRYSR